MSQQASGTLVALAKTVFAVPVLWWESSSSGLSSCAAAGWAAPPRAQGLWSAQGLTFPQARLQAAAHCEKLQA